MGISVENYVGILEDSLMMNKAVAIARNFQFLEQRPGCDDSPSTYSNPSGLLHRASVFAKEEYRRMSYFFKDSIGRSAGRRAQNAMAEEEGCPLIDPSSPEDIAFRNPPPLSVSAPMRKRYIDLWPIQMMSTLGPQSYTYSFDTYTMVLQMGCILHMNNYWKTNYALRVLVFVENFEDVEDEAARVKMLLKGLRIDAEVKPVWLKATSSTPSDSDEYERQYQIVRRHQRSAYIRQTRQKSTRPLDDVKEGLPTKSPQREKLTRRSTLMIATKISKHLLKQYHTSSEMDDTIGALSEQEEPTTHSIMEDRSYNESASPSNSTTAQNSPRLHSPINDSDDDDELQEKEYAAPLPESVFNGLETNVQHKILNQLMRHHSSSFTTAVIFSTLPAPDPGIGFSRSRSMEYIESLDVLTQDLPSIILVHGKGLTVTMAL